MLEQAWYTTRNHTKCSCGTNFSCGAWTHWATPPWHGPRSASPSEQHRRTFSSACFFRASDWDRSRVAWLSRIRCCRRSSCSAGRPRHARRGGGGGLRGSGLSSPPQVVFNNRLPSMSLTPPPLRRYPQSNGYRGLGVCLFGSQPGGVLIQLRLPLGHLGLHGGRGGPGGTRPSMST